MVSYKHLKELMEEGRALEARNMVKDSIPKVRTEDQKRFP